MNAAPTPPGPVLGVQILLGVAFVVGFLQAVPGGPFSSGAAPSLSSFVTFLATGCAAWVMGWAAHHGSAVLRGGFSAGLVALFCAVMFADVRMHPAQWVQLSVFTVASALLYAPAIQEWFVIRHAQRTDPLRAHTLWQIAHERRRLRELAPPGVGTFISLCVVLAACATAGAAIQASLLT